MLAPSTSKLQATAKSFIPSLACSSVSAALCITPPSDAHLRCIGEGATASATGYGTDLSATDTLAPEIRREHGSAAPGGRAVRLQADLLWVAHAAGPGLDAHDAAPLDQAPRLVQAIVFGIDVDGAGNIVAADEAFARLGQQTLG